MNKIEKLASKYIYWPELENPFQKNISFGENTLSDFHSIVHKNVNSKKVDVENEIVEFYALNQYLSQQRIKDGDIMNSDLIDTYKAYKNKIDVLSEKMFSYIFITSMMEARHCHDFTKYDFDSDDIVDKWIDKYIEKYDKYPKDLETQQYKKSIIDEHFTKQCFSYKSKNSSEFYPTFIKCYEFLSNSYSKNNSTEYRGGLIKNILPDFKKSDIKIEDFLKTLSIIFEKNKFVHGYGGTAWKNIVDHGLKFSKGELNAEVFVDQAFSLEHNSGCMFTKSVIFNTIDNVRLKTADTYIGIRKTQFLLNMQHSGELLNFLSLNNYTNNSIDKIIQNLKLEHSTNKKPNILIEVYLNKFFSDIKIEAAKLLISPILIKIIKKEKNNLSTINFKAFLSEQKNEYGKTEKFLTYHQQEFLEIAQKITSNFNKPIIKKKNYINNPLFEVFDISKIPLTHQNKDILGGKAFGLSEMNKIHLPIPKAVVWTCENSKSFELFPDLWAKTLYTQMSGINSFNKDIDGNPVMVSIRSGAPVSMPGMMDTILNVGIDSTNYGYFSQKIGQATTDECAILFMKLFTKSYFNKEYQWPKTLKLANKKFKKILNKFNIKTSDDEFPLSKEKQIAFSLEAVFQSWFSDRAVAYRNHHHIDHDMGTAAIMQHMVLGNLNEKSCTGVLFSRDCINGKKGIIGEFLVCGQGEEVVSGEVTPQNINEMKKWNPQIYEQLSEITAQLEEKTGKIQDIEFTVENGKLYILQCRTAVSSHNAKTQLLYEKFNQNKITFNDFLTNIEHINLLSNYIVNTKDKPELTGISASPGVIKGICVKNERDIQKFCKKAKDESLKFILISQETKPEHAPIMIKADAFLTQRGGFTSHAAILARSWNKPCIVGSAESKILKAGEVVTMDAQSGQIWLGVKDIVKKKDNSIIKDIISSNLINLEYVNTKQDKIISKINNQKYWMNFGSKTKEIKPVVKKFNKFLDMGQLAFIKMSVAAKYDSSMTMNK